MIIYAPIIASTIPAFVDDKIVIPFRHNVAVGCNDFTGYQLIIKDLNSMYIGTSTCKKSEEETNEAVFKFNGSLTVGQYYKFQLAYINAAESNGIIPAQEISTLALSSVSIGKYLGDSVEFQVSQLNEYDINQSQIEYVGNFVRPIQSEPLYSYRFDLIDLSGNIFETSDTKIWNVDNDVKTNGNFNSQFSFHPLKDLNPEEAYELKLSITTVNGYSSSKSYQIQVGASYNPTFDEKILTIKQMPESGGVQLTIQQRPSKNCQLLIERMMVGENIWYEITRFSTPEVLYGYTFSFLDDTVEHGKQYIYSIRQYYNQYYSSRVLSQPILVIFDDIFLSDGQKTLKIKFNPKVSSMKTTTLEQKTDTIGSKFPFFFRNGNIGYKEIPISGLISYQMDDMEGFITKEELGIDKISGNLTHENFAAERKFKLAVLDWLNNGQPKLFRSPAEGNYIVRLMNISLSPNETLGRMLHTFSATGYEIDNPDYNSLKKHNIIKKIKTPNFSLPILQNISGNNYAQWKNIKNLTWNSNSLTEEDNVIFLTLNGVSKSYKNFTGQFKTPQDVVYETADFSSIGANSTYSFMQVSQSLYDPSKDEFAKNNGLLEVVSE